MRDSPESVIAHLKAKGVEFTVGPACGSVAEPDVGANATGRWEVNEPGKSKYRNRKTEIDGRTFDSKKEANHYLDLREQQRAGLITDLRCQVEIPLIVNGRKIGDYVADFVYTKGEREVIEDVKSAVTRRLPVYRIKRKVLEANGIIIQEV